MLNLEQLRNTINLQWRIQRGAPPPLP